VMTICFLFAFGGFNFFFFQSSHVFFFFFCLLRSDSWNTKSLKEGTHRPSPNHTSTGHVFF